MIKLLILAIFAYLAWKAWVTVRGERRLEREERGRLGANREGPVKQLVLDPECQTYVPEESAERLNLGGKMVYFCCPECREAYLKKRQGEKG